MKGKWKERKREGAAAAKPVEPAAREREPAARQRADAGAAADAAHPARRARSGQGDVGRATPRGESTAGGDGVVVVPRRETRTDQVLYRRADGELTLVETEALESVSAADDRPAILGRHRRRRCCSEPARSVRPAARAARRRRTASTAASPARTSRRPAWRSPAFDEYLQPGRVLIFGESEIRYLESLDAAGTRRRAAAGAARHDFPCVLITGGFTPPRGAARRGRTRAACRC